MAKESRRVDGKPETAADKRFFDLRQSGYKGPVDQDGRAVMARTDRRGGFMGLGSRRNGK